LQADAPLLGQKGGVFLREELDLGVEAWGKAGLQEGLPAQVQEADHLVARFQKLRPQVAVEEAP
jgi:hypothetical protein